MHYSFKTYTENLKPGKTIVFSTYNSRELVFGKVMTNDYKNGYTVDLSDGRKLKLHTENWSNEWKDQDGKSGYYIEWTNLIPNLPDDEVFSYVKTIKSAKNRPIFIHVDNVEDGKITGRFITRTPDPKETEAYGDLLDVGDADEDYVRLNFVDQDGVRTIDLPAVIKTYSQSYSKRLSDDSRPVSAIFCNQDIEPGDLIIADDINMYYVGDELITVINNRNSVSINHGINVVKKNTSLDDIRAFLLLNVRQEDVPENSEPDVGMSLTSREKAMFMSIEEIENQLWQARLRLQPDEAIVLWLNDDLREGRTNPFIMGFTGHLFHTVDDFGDYIEGHGVHEGLWLMKEPSFNGGYDHEGNYDCDLDVVYVPATPEDVQRLVDGRELDEGVTDVVAHFMEKARIAHGEEMECKNSMKP